jgi:UDP-GlcNAc:undecaprenyl-phosphate/decaprenyl-phosphate GlcNAc-1-phosphate transferase
VREYGLTLLVTAAVTYLLTPLVRRVAISVGAMHAARDRDVHVVPIPLLGGLAIYAGLAAGLMVASQVEPLRGNVFQGSRMGAGLLLAGGLIVAVGAVDDRWGLNPISKLAGQVAAAAILVWSGAQLAWLPEPGGGALILTPNEATALTILVVVATINAVNFIDGLDGLAAGIVCIAALSFFVYYFKLTRVTGITDQAGPALAAALVAGACIGFLPHNFYPARIFMGDTGAMLLGLLLAYTPISSIASLNYWSLVNYKAATLNRFPEVLPLLLPAAILVIPYADLLLAVIRRTRAGLSPFAPDRRHLHHRLLDIGHSHRLSVLIMYLWAALFAGTVVWLSVANTQVFVFAVATLAAVLALLLMSMPRLRWWKRPRGARGRGGPAISQPASVTTGQAMTDADGQVLADANGQAMTDANGQVPADANGQAMTDANGQVLGGAPGRAMTDANGQAITDAPGQAITDAPGRSPAAGIGQSAADPDTPTTVLAVQALTDPRLR